MTPDPAQVDVACSVNGCGRPVKSRGVCSTHHYRLTKFGDVHHKESPPSGIHGHEFTPENTYTPPGAPNRRTCRECMRARRSA